MRFQTLLALLMGLCVSAASAETYRILERTPQGDVISRAAEVQEPRDGIDPVTYHETFSTPTDSRHAQILWVSSGETIVVDRNTIDDSGGYPMVVSATIPDGGDLLYQIYSSTNGQIRNFTHATNGPDWSVNQEKLATLAAGEYTLHVTIRTPGQNEIRATQRIEIRGNAGKDTGSRDPVIIRPPIVIPPVVTPPVVIDPIDIAPLIEWVLPDDGRIIYVSSSTGNDNNNGRTPQTAVRSLDRGYALMRDNRPDWLLLKRGDVFDLPANKTGDFRAWYKSGRSATEPMIIGAYGDENAPRPRLNSNGNGGLNHLYIDNLVIRDLHLYANRRDPKSPDFNGGGGRRELGLHMVRAEDVVIQGCLIEYFNMNVMLRTELDIDETRLRGIRFHRCTIRNAYALDGDDSHGMYGWHVAGLSITQCVFDHNGWAEDIDDVYRTGRSHNVYFSDCTQINLEGNVFCRESYLSVKFRCETEGLCRDITIRDNLFIGCAYPLEFGANGDIDSINYANIELKNNVFARTTGWPVNAPRNLAVTITRTSGALVQSNLFIDNGVEGSQFNEAVRASAYHALEDIVIRDNDAFLPTPRGDDMFSTHHREQRSVPEVTFINNRENIAHGRYVDPSVTMEKYLQTRGITNRSLNNLMKLMSDSTVANNPRVSIADMVQYYRNGFTLVTGN
ncbi:MAG: hypothetical protein ACIAXF_07065 [Phycisphaerales bacterium JB063]